MICSALLEFRIHISKDVILAWTERVSVDCELMRRGAIPFVETKSSIMTYKDGIAKEADNDAMDSYEKFIKTQRYAQICHDALLKSEKIEGEAYENIETTL